MPVTRLGGLRYNAHRSAGASQLTGGPEVTSFGPGSP